MDDDEEYPKYRASAFLFGNVNKQGQIEAEYARIDGCTDISQVETCKIPEFASTIDEIMSDAPTASNSDISTSELMNETSPSVDAKDYYDESELIKLDEFDNSFGNQLNGDDDYDSVDRPEDQYVPVSSVTNSQDSQSIQPIKAASSAPNSPPVTPGSSPTTRLKSWPSSPFPAIPSEVSYLDLPVSSAATKIEDDSLIMPPPLHPAPVALSRQRQQFTDKSPIPHDQHHPPRKVLNTPLGNLLPPEFANVEISKLFPGYSPHRIPKWGDIIKLPYPPRKYDLLKHKPVNYSTKRQKDELVGGGSPERIHLIYRGLLDLGVVPTRPEQFEQAERHDQLSELQQPPDPNENCLAGAEGSWWQVAFRERLSQLEGASSTNDKNSKTRDANTIGKTASVSGASNGSAGHTNSIEHDKIRVCSFRMGAAKHWYDELGIPEDADIATWRHWRKNSAPNMSSIGPTPAVPTVSDGELGVADNSVIDLLVRNGDWEAGDDQGGVTSVDVEDMFLPFHLTDWEKNIILDPDLARNKVQESLKYNAVNAGWIASVNHRTMAAFQDGYRGKYPGIVGHKALCGSSQGNQPGLTSSTEGPNSSLAANHPVFNGPFSLFPVENPRLMDDSWAKDIILDPDLRTPASEVPYLLTLDKNDEWQSLDAVINDDEVMAAPPAAALGNAGKKQQQQSEAHANRASFQVIFGYASTRGTLTGALAKAEKGAEKVKRILGKHGFLAEGEWNEDGGESDENAAAGNNASVEGEADSEAAATNMASVAAAASGLPPKDPLNLSNDEFYAIRSGGVGVGGGGLARCGPLQHSTPAVELWPGFFPTYNNPTRLRQFHRIPLKQYTRGLMSQYNTPVPVNNLTRIIQRKAKEREEEKMAAGGGDIFFMRTPQDLSGFDGEVVLFEYSEEYPPFLNQVGMATRLVNYYRSLIPKDPSLSPDPASHTSPPDLPYGSLVNVGSTDSPFLGFVRPGGCLQSLENNMFRAPVFYHETPVTDFLVIRNRNGLWIRKAPTAFTVGQEVPLMEVPGPNSKRANNFARDFLQVYILRLFLKSTDEPKRIKMEEIRHAFPNHSESSVRKRLKICADFKRTGADASWWVLRPDYRLPSEEEIRYLVQPEDYCAFLSMQAAELRLKDAGYGEKSLIVLDENPEAEEKEGQPKMEDEVRAAPWYTTRAYLAARRGGCFLELHGPADPTGCGEAFSYSKTSAKPGALFRQAGGEAARGLLKDKKTVTGTDADLRKLHLREARELLRSYGIAESDLRPLKRWEIIDLVRFTSTERAKQVEEEDTAKFARGNRLSMEEQIRCYREECQRIFDLQNRVLSNPELLSSDEEEEEEEEFDDEDEAGATGLDNKGDGTAGGGGAHGSIGGVRLSSLPSSAAANQQAAKNVQSLLNNRITSEQLRERQEEAEREELKRSVELGKSLSKNRRKQGMMTNDTSASDQHCRSEEAVAPPPPKVYEATAASAGAILDLSAPFGGAQKKALRITRTYNRGTLKECKRVEIVPWSPVVEIYLKIKQTRDLEQIHNFIGSDEAYKEQKRKEKRRQQDQLRRMRKQQELLRARGLASGNEPLRDAHGRLIPINRLPGFAGTHVSTSSSRKRHKPSSNLLKMRCGACGRTGHMRTNKECPMYGRSDAVAPGPSQGRSSGGSLRSSRTILPAGVKPEQVAAAKALTSKSVAELIGTKSDTESSMQHASDAQPPRSIGPSRLSEESDNDNMDFEGHRGDDYHHGYHSEDSHTFDGSREEKRSVMKLKISTQLLNEIDRAKQILDVVESTRDGANRGSTSAGGAGARSSSGGAGRRGRAFASAADDDYPTSTIRHRGNRRRIDPQVAINHVFEGIYKGITQIPGYKIFMHPVKEKEFPEYYKQIKNPMDLSQIRMKINNNAYSTREEFLSDIRLIYENSTQFNGKHSSCTETAMKICSHVMAEFAQKEMKLMRLEPLVNPMLDSNDLVRLGFLLQKAVDAMRSVESSRAFHYPVDKRRYPDYYKMIANPMDLSTLEKNIKDRRYHSREEFFTDANLLLSNCRKYNGDDSFLTGIARKMLDKAHAMVESMAETIEAIEESIHRGLDEISNMDAQSVYDAAGRDEASNVAVVAVPGEPVPSTSRGVKRTQEGQQGKEFACDSETELDSSRMPKRRRLNEESFDAASPQPSGVHEDMDLRYNSDNESHYSGVLSQPNYDREMGNEGEHSRMSIGEAGVGYSMGNAADPQVAQYLQLSSESSDEMSVREGGELIDDAMAAATALAEEGGAGEDYRAHPNYTPSASSENANHAFESPASMLDEGHQQDESFVDMDPIGAGVVNDEASNQSDRQGGSHATFFISSDEAEVEEQEEDEE